MRQKSTENAESYQNQTRSHCKETLRETKGTKDSSHGGKGMKIIPKKILGQVITALLSLVYKLYDSLKSFFSNNTSISNLQLNMEWCVISPNNALNRFKISGRY